MVVLDAVGGFYGVGSNSSALSAIALGVAYGFVGVSIAVPFRLCGEPRKKLALAFCCRDPAAVKLSPDECRFVLLMRCEHCRDDTTRSSITALIVWGLGETIDAS